MSPIIKFNTIDSTNDFLMKNGNDYSHLTSVTAKTQTKGKGRYNRKWLNSKKDFLFSILIKNKLSLTDIHILNYLAPLSLSIFLKEIIPEVKIKFPNDILINNKKIAGILVETSINSNKFNYGVLGYGINIEKFPHIEKKGIQPDCLKNHINKIPSLDSTINGVIKNIENLLNLSNLKENIFFSYNSFLSSNIVYKFKFSNDRIEKLKIDYIDSNGNIHVYNEKRKSFILPEDSTYISDSEVIENDLS